MFNVPHFHIVKISMFQTTSCPGPKTHCTRTLTQYCYSTQLYVESEQLSGKRVTPFNNDKIEELQIWAENTE